MTSVMPLCHLNFNMAGKRSFWSMARVCMKFGRIRVYMNNVNPVNADHWEAAPFKFTQGGKLLKHVKQS